MSDARDQLANLLTLGQAHATALKALERVPDGLWGTKVPGAPYTPWMLLEHLRIAQQDILEYAVGPSYQPRAFPRDYWPPSEQPPSIKAVRDSLKGFRADLERTRALVLDPKVNLDAPVKGGEPGHTLLREVLLVADHNAYHTGQLVLLLRLLGAWDA